MMLFLSISFKPLNNGINIFIKLLKLSWIPFILSKPTNISLNNSFNVLPPLSEFNNCALSYAYWTSESKLFSLKQSL